MYDLVIVGAGLVGSACARHASLRDDLAVCLIGPEEPETRQGHSIFGAYYDEGRITRSTASDPFWAELAVDSIARYHEIQRESGIHFYKEVGALTFGTANSSYMQDTLMTAAKIPDKCHVLSSTQLKQELPYIHVLDDDVGVYERADAGYINPRQLRLAEQNIARSHGCTIFTDVVNHVTKSSGGASGGTFIVITDTGRHVETRRVLLATGAFTGFRQLLPGNQVPHLKLLTQAVLFAEIEQDDLQLVSSMPTMLCEREAFNAGGTYSVNPTEKFNCYIMPPIQYPDGKLYIKIGHGSQYEKTLTSEADVASWYTSDVPGHITSGLRNMLRSIFPGLRPVSYNTDSCVTSHTDDSMPYLDIPYPGLGVALGGNGYAAKSCDKMGQLAVDLLLDGVWGYPQYPLEAFKLKYKLDAKL